MPNTKRIVTEGPAEGTVRTADGQILHVPPDWELLPPGDATLTRRVKATGPCWAVQHRRGRKIFSKGVWAPSTNITLVKTALDSERSTDAYARRRAADKSRRDRKQDAYVAEFRRAVLEFLNFAPRHAALAEEIADAVTRHATPVGSGTVARTRRISVGQRADSAVIAWLRHQTTGYDSMQISRQRGRRREVRRMLAAQSRILLQGYRDGRTAEPTCPLQRALADHAPVDNERGDACRFG